MNTQTFKKQTHKDWNAAFQARKAANVLIANSVSDPKKKLEELLGVEIKTIESLNE